MLKNDGSEYAQRVYAQDIVCYVIVLSNMGNHSVDKDDWDFLNAEIGDPFP
jgi:hypothetical protein